MTTRLPVAESSAWTGMSVNDAMRRRLVACTRDATLPTMAEIMTSHRVHAVVIAPPAEGVSLVVTLRALVTAAVNGATDATAADLALEPIATLSTDATLGEAAELMAVNYATHVLAADPTSGAPKGIVSSLDVAAAVGGVSFWLARLPLPTPVRRPLSARKLSDARVGDVMRAGVVSATPDAPLRTIARIMAEEGVHCVAIAGIDRTGGRDPHFTWGLIADIDLVTALHGGSANLAAGTIAATAPIALQQDDSLGRAAALMVKHDTSHLVVVSPGWRALRDGVDLRRRPFHGSVRTHPSPARRNLR